jgi:hypothetical protein
MAATAENESEAAHITSTTSKHERKATVIATNISSKNILTSFKSLVNRVETLDTNVIQVATATAENGERGGDIVSTCQLFGEERIGGCGCRSRSFSCERNARRRHEHDAVEVEVGSRRCMAEEIDALMRRWN